MYYHKFNLQNKSLVWLMLFILQSKNIFAVDDHDLVRMRCNLNSLSIDEAHGRNGWAKKCKNNFMDDDPQFEFLLDTLSKAPNRPYYPLISNDAENDFNAPISVNNNCEKYTKFHTFCVSSCFTPTQKILFKDGYLPIKSAVDGRKQGLVTLQSDATLDYLSFHSQEVESYMASFKDGVEDIVIIGTNNGASLEVTKDHPILLSSGVMVKANDLKKGESLIDETGQFDKISSLSRMKYFGKVYNVAPKSTNLIENIIVAGGLLVGSANYQFHEMFRDVLYRQVLRSQIKI